MKNASKLMRLTLVLAFFCSLLSRADSPAGIRFFKGTWEELLATAKKQNKPIFVDVYTTWCGPCKLMAKQAFPDPKVGEKFNANFINYTLDAEKGEGVSLAKQYAVTFLPTSLYLSPDGDLLHRATGYVDIQGLVNEAEKAILATNDPNPLAKMEREYQGGRRDAEFLRTYLTKRAKLSKPNANALKAFLKVVPAVKWMQEDNLVAIAGNLTTAYSPAFEPLLSEARRIQFDSTKALVFESIKDAVSAANSHDFASATTEAGLNLYLANLLKESQLWSAKLDEVGREDMLLDLRLQFYRRVQNREKYRALAVPSAERLMKLSVDSLSAQDSLAYQEFIKKIKSIPDSVKATPRFARIDRLSRTNVTDRVRWKLTTYGQVYTELMINLNDLDQALNWSNKALLLQRSPEGLDNHAHLLNKMGYKTEAIKHQQEAITLAKAVGEDATFYEKRLIQLTK